MSQFSITKELKTVGEIHAITTQLLSSIPEKILFTKSKEELCAYILNQFNFPDNTIDVNNSAGLEEKCTIILSLMGIDEDFEKDIQISRDKKFDSQLDRFLYYFLDFTELPGVIKEDLEEKVTNDLKIIDGYVTEYEKIDFIKKGEKPRNHSQRTFYDFYNRCIDEKGKIEAYLAADVNDRALSKAQRDNLWGLGILMFEEFRDRPYRIPMPKSNEYFEQEKIDKVGHRLGEIPIKKGRELKLIYKQDKEEFYKELEKSIPEENVLETMINQVNFLPFLPQQRKDLFKELIDLYKNKKWFGFYALALTQIEGLFTEMCILCEPNINNPYASLPDKVDIVRPYHPYSENRFDYFQYHLPILRNRFLHLGLDGNEKMEILCKELLWDLEEVVSIFLELNIDALWMLRILRKSDHTDFSTYSGLCNYFELIGKLKKNKQLKYFKDEIDHVNQITVPSGIVDIVFILEEQICQLLEVIKESVELQSEMNGFKLDLEKISFQEIADNKGPIKTALKDAFNSQFKGEIEELMLILDFIKSCRKNVDMELIPADTLATLEEIEKKYEPLLTKIKLINMQTTGL